jgi:hypothetical protein
MNHKITLIDKKEENINYFTINNTKDYLDLIEKSIKSELFFVEIEPDNDNIDFEDYLKIISILNNDNVEIPKEINNVELLIDWINAWKTIEEVYALSL